MPLFLQLTEILRITSSISEAVHKGRSSKLIAETSWKELREVMNDLSKKAPRSFKLSIVLLAISLPFVGFWAARRSHAVDAQDPSTLSRAVFTTDGIVNLPNGFRRWEHVGTRVKTSGKSILDGTPIFRPQVLDSYVEPSAFVQYKKTGIWPNGAQIVKELSIIRIWADCDKFTFSCTTTAGPGIFEDSYIGVGMMVKDTKRFPNAPGNWGYFRFLSDGSGYAKRSAVVPANQCESCHVAYASKEDYVFTDTHIGLTSQNTH
jgi:hypothetical protein